MLMKCCWSLAGLRPLGSGGCLWLHRETQRGPARPPAARLSSQPGAVPWAAVFSLLVPVLSHTENQCPLQALSLPVEQELLSPGLVPVASGAAGQPQPRVCSAERPLELFHPRHLQLLLSTAS